MHDFCVLAVSSPEPEVFWCRSPNDNTQLVDRTASANSSGPAIPLDSPCRRSWNPLSPRLKSVGISPESSEPKSGSAAAGVPFPECSDGVTPDSDRRNAQRLSLCWNARSGLFSVPRHFVVNYPFVENLLKKWSSPVVDPPVSRLNKATMILGMGPLLSRTPRRSHLVCFR